MIGAGVHGLSTAWHLARAGEQVLVVDKTDVAAGASGIACGIVRNNYFQPAMQELMAACVEVWESDPAAFHYHPAGYIALGPPAQESDLTEVHERQQRIGYPSELHLGEAEVERHMRSLYHDWRAPGLTVCLHEHAGGYAFNRESMLGLADKARAAGAQIVTGVEVTGFEFDGSGACTRVRTSAGDVDVDQVVVAVGPWIASLWSMLGLADRLDVRQPDGSLVADQPMWTYWYLQEGEVEFDPSIFVTDDGKSSPVLHVDSDQPLRADDGELITDEPWGVYFKPDRETVQGGAQPIRLGHTFEVDPYPTGTVDAEFPELWSASLSHCLSRFEGARDAVPPDALGRRRRVHGRQLPGLRLHAPERVRRRGLQPRLQDDRRRTRDREGARGRALLAPAPVPLRAVRHGDLHPVSHSPYPWS